MAKILFHLKIPDGLELSELSLQIFPDGDVSFSREPLLRICAENGFPEQYLEEEEVVSEIITRWYKLHLEHGGEPDSVLEDLIYEAKEEDRAGSLSHQPGRG